MSAGFRRTVRGGLLLLAVALVGCGGTDEPSPQGAPQNPASATPSLSSPAATTFAPLPEPRTEVAGVAWQGGIVVVGGFVADGSTSRRADLWQPASDRWTPLPDLPVALHHTTLGVLDGDVWLVGGFTDGFVPSAGTWLLRPGAQGWEPGPDLPVARGAPATVVVDEVLWVLGGVSPDGTLTSTARLSEDRTSWLTGPDLGVPREHLGAAVLDGAPIAVAGRDGGLDTNLRSSEVVGPDGVRQGPPVVKPRGGNGATTLGGMPCTAGGEEPGGTIAEVECLREGRWQVVARMEEPRHGLAVVALDGRLHLIGGGPEPGLTVSGRHDVLRFG